MHCDLKPENILLHGSCLLVVTSFLTVKTEQDGVLKLKLADWGYAQVKSLFWVEQRMLEDRMM